MDEPTSSLTLTETRRLLDIIRDLKTQGVSVIYISHRLDEVIEISDRVIGLRDGKNAGELQKAEITRENMVRMMVGRDLKDFYVHAGGDQSRHDQNWLVVNGLRTTKYPGQEISFTARQGEVLGVEFSGSTDEADRILIVDAAVSGGLSRKYWHVWPGIKGRFVGACPLPHSETFQWMIRLAPDEQPPQDLAQINARIQAHTHNKRLVLRDIQWQSVFRPNIRLAQNYRRGRVLLVDDEQSILEHHEDVTAELLAQKPDASALP